MSLFCLFINLYGSSVNKKIHSQNDIGKSELQYKEEYYMQIGILMDSFRVNGRAQAVQLKLKCSQSAIHFSPFVTFIVTAQQSSRQSVCS